MDFNQAEKKFKDLKAKFEAGALSENEFKTQLEELMVQDEDGNWWMIGYETELWYRHDGTDWIRADPPHSLSLQEKTENKTAEEETFKNAERIPKIRTEATHTTKDGMTDIKKNIFSQQDQKSWKITTTAIKEKSIWKFGKRQLWYGAAGVFVYTILSFIPYPYSPTHAVLIFFSLSFGPWVGLITGLIGPMINVLLGSFGFGFGFNYMLALIVNALIGVSVGLATRKFKNFRNPREIFKAIGICVIVSIFTTLFGSISLFYALFQLILNSIFLAVLMISFAKTARPI